MKNHIHCEKQIYMIIYSKIDTEDVCRSLFLHLPKQNDPQMFDLLPQKKDFSCLNVETHKLGRLQTKSRLFSSE